MTAPARMSAADYRKSVGQSPPGSDLVRFKSEDHFQSTVVQWLDLLEFRKGEIFAFHPANGGKRSLITAAILQRMGVRPGVGDLCFLQRADPQSTPPRSAVSFLELKMPDGKPSKDQKAFAAICRRLGIPYLIARTFDEVAAALASFGVRYQEPMAARLIRGGR